MKNFYKEYDSYLRNKKRKIPIKENEIIELIKLLIISIRGDRFSDTRIIIRNRLLTDDKDGIFLCDPTHLLKETLEMICLSNRGFYRTERVREFFENVRHKKNVFFEDHYLKDVPYICKTDNFEWTIHRRDAAKLEKVKYMKGDKIFFHEALCLEYVIPISDIIDQLLKVDIYKKDDTEILRIIEKVQPILMSLKEHRILRRNTKKTDLFLDAYRRNFDKIDSKITFLDPIGKEVKFDDDYDFFKKITI